MGGIGVGHGYLVGGGLTVAASLRGRWENLVPFFPIGNFHRTISLF